MIKDAFHSFLNDFSIFFLTGNLFLAALGLCCCTDYSLVVVWGLLIVVASFVACPRAQGLPLLQHVGPVVGLSGFSRCGALA